MATISMLLIIVSVVVSCLETTDYFSHTDTPPHQAIHIIEIVCVISFSLELFLRFAVCPCKRDFLKQIMNWLDLAAIAPFYLHLFLTNSDMNSIVILRIVRLIRVFRIFKLSRHSYSLQILGHTLRSSLSELFLLGFFLSIGVVVFSSLMFYAERDSKENKFTSIPASFWWAVVTMTTVGYGDFTPKSLPGRLVGTCCAICGVLCVALPIPVIVSNFSLYYSHAKARQKAVKKKRPLVIGAANALKVIESLVGPRVEDPGTPGEIGILATGRLNGLSWPGNSFESSEASPSLYRRRNSWLTNRQQILSCNADQGRNFSKEPKYTAGKCEATYTCKTNDKCGGVKDDEESREDQYVNVENKQSNNDKEFSLPTIQIHRNSSSSQLNESNYDDLESQIGCLQELENEEKEQVITNGGPVGIRKKKAKLGRSVKVSNTPGDTPGSKNNFPPGRMGRRDSVFVVGFMGKKWKAKAAQRTAISLHKRRENSDGLKRNQQGEKACFDLLEVSPTTASHRGSTLDTQSIATTLTELSTPTLSVSPATSPKPFHHNFTPRRSSCPLLQTRTIERSSSPVENKGTGWENEETYGHSGTRKVSKEVRGIQVDNPISNCSNKQSLTGGFEPMNDHRARDSFSSTSSESCSKGFENGWSRSSSPLVRQRALFQTETDGSDFDEDHENTVEKHKQVLENGRIHCNDLYKKEKTHQLCNGGVNHVTGPVLPNRQLAASEVACTVQEMSGNTEKQRLSERRKAPPLTIDFLNARKNISDYLNLLNGKKTPDTMNEKGLNYSMTSSPHAQQLPQGNERGSETTCYCVKNHLTPKQCDDKVKDKLTTTEDFVLGYQKETSSPMVDSFHQCDERTGNIRNTAFHSRDTISLRNLPKNAPVSGIGTQYNHVTSSQTGISSKADGKQWETGGQRKPRTKIEKKDSAISSMESRSSIESLPSFTEKDGDRGLLKTISEVEASEYYNGENTLLTSLFFENGQCNNSRYHTVDIKDETTV